MCASVDLGMSFKLSLVVGAIFGLLAGVMSFLIVFDEYRKHQFSGWRLWKEGLVAGAFALVVFLLMSLAAGAWL